MIFVAEPEKTEPILKTNVMGVLTGINKGCMSQFYNTVVEGANVKKVESVLDVPQKPHYVILINKVIKFTAGVASSNVKPNIYSTCATELCHYVTEDYSEWIKVLENLYREEPERKDIRFYEPTYFPQVTVTIKIE